MEAYQSNTISLIHNYRKHSLLFDYMEDETGELKYVCTFDLQRLRRMISALSSEFGNQIAIAEID